MADQINDPINSSLQPNLKKLSTKVRYPWFSSLYALALVLFLMAVQFAEQIPGVAALLNQLPIKFDLPLAITLTSLFILLLGLDIKGFQRNSRRAKQHEQQLKKEVQDVWTSKKHLQMKAHTYSGHADKLKLFISDKLLEYIEYDEKFLHFKGIASEVRHNGVISYDIVQQVLNQALLEVKANKDSELDAEKIQQGLNAIQYLWDLLDLSTADNIALYIASKLADQEEAFYQGQLNPAHSSSEQQAHSFQPQQALNNSLYHLMDSSDLLIAQQKNGQGQSAQWQFEDKQFTIQGDNSQSPDTSLLGKSNHLRLAIENLIKNAQFFSQKVPFKQKSDRIRLNMLHDETNWSLSVYNRGPHIPADEQEKVTQLGFSSRRSSGHHGKGLGLYFVNEIVKGYEGELQFSNIHNQEMELSVRIELEDGKISTQLISVQLEDGFPVICSLEDHPNSPERKNHHSLEWQFDKALKSIEVSSNLGQETQSINVDRYIEKDKPTFSYIDNNQIPGWSLDVSPRRRGKSQHSLNLNILDIAGVQIEIKLPSIQARMGEL
jgi:signal transduction histidine kinase